MVENEETASGQASEQQIATWKGRFRELQEIRVKVTDSDTAVCYLKPADRNITAYALTKASNSQPIEAGEFLLMNCWLGGDERCNPNSPQADDRIVIAAALEAAASVEFLAATSKKL